MSMSRACGSPPGMLSLPGKVLTRTLPPVSFSTAAHISLSRLSSGVPAVWLWNCRISIGAAARVRRVDTKVAAAAPAPSVKPRREMGVMLASLTCAELQNRGRAQCAMMSFARSGTDVGPALLFELGDAHDARRHHANSVNRNHFVAFALFRRRLGVAAHAVDDAGDFLLGFGETVLHRRFVGAEHGDAGTVGHDLDLKLLTPAVIEFLGIDRVGQSQVHAFGVFARNLKDHAVQLRRVLRDGGVHPDEDGRNEQDGDGNGGAKTLEHCGLPWNGGGTIEAAGPIYSLKWKLHNLRFILL